MKTALLLACAALVSPGAAFASGVVEAILPAGRNVSAGPVVAAPERVRELGLVLENAASTPRAGVSVMPPQRPARLGRLGAVTRFAVATPAPLRAAPTLSASIAAGRLDQAAGELRRLYGERGLKLAEADGGAPPPADAGAGRGSSAGTPPDGGSPKGAGAAPRAEPESGSPREAVSAARLELQALDNSFRAASSRTDDAWRLFVKHRLLKETQGAAFALSRIGEHATAEELRAAALVSRSRLFDLRWTLQTHAPLWAHPERQAWAAGWLRSVGGIIALLQRIAELPR